MPSYSFLTGRERTVTWSGTVTGAAYDNLIYQIPRYPLEGKRRKTPAASITLFASDDLQTGAVRIIWESGVLVNFAGYITIIGERLTIETRWGIEQQTDYRTYYFPTPYEGSINGTWQVTATLQELVTVVEEYPAGPADADNLPPRISLRFTERIKPGSTVYVNATCHNIAMSRSFFIPDGHPVVATLCSPQASVSIEARLYEGESWSGDCSISYFCSAGTLSEPNFYQTQTQTNPDYAITRTISVSSSQSYAYAFSEGFRSGDYAYISTGAHAKAYIDGVKQAEASFRVLAFDAPYPEPLVVRIRTKRNTWTDVNLPSGGTGSITIVQKSYKILYLLYGSVEDYTVHEYESVLARLSPESLTAIDEDSFATRLFGHGWLYHNVRFRHNTRHVLDTCNQLLDSNREWASIQDCSLTVSGSSIMVTPTGSTPKIRRTCLDPPHEYWSSYGFLRLRVKADAPNAPITVVIGHKRYSTTTNVPANTWTDLYIDLCCPSNASAPYDLQNTMYPDGRIDGDYWGITRVSEVQFELADTIWFIDELSLDVEPWDNRQSPHNVPNHSITICPSRRWWQDTGRGYEVRRLITGQSDGKLALEIEDVRRDNFNYLPISIHGISLLIRATDAFGARYWPGWECEYTINPPTSIPQRIVPLQEYYLTASRPASWIGGAGLIMTASSWESTAKRIQLPGSNFEPVPVQVLYDEIDWYPGCTDVWGFSGTSSNDPLRLLFGTVLRARAFGLVIDAVNKRRFTQGGVQLQKIDNDENGGIGSVEGWKGYFETNQPYAKGFQVYKLVGGYRDTSIRVTSRQYFTRLPARTVSTISPATPPLKYFATCNFTCTRVVEAYYDRGNNRLYIQWSGMGYSIPFTSAVICPISLSDTEEPVHLSLVSSDKTWLTVLDSELSSSPPGVKTTIYRLREGSSSLEMTAVTPTGSIPPLLCFGYILLLPCSIKVEPLQDYVPVVESGEGILSGVYRFPDFLKAIRSGQSVQPLLHVIPQGLPSWDKGQPFPFWFHRWHWNLFARDFLLIPQSSTQITICEIAPVVSQPDNTRKLLPAHTLPRATGVDNEKARLWATEGRFLILEGSQNSNILKGIEGQCQRSTMMGAVSVIMTYTQRNDFDASIILHEGSWKVVGWDLLPDREWAIVMVGYEEPDGLRTSIWRWGNRSSPPLILLREV